MNVKYRLNQPLSPAVLALLILLALVALMAILLVVGPELSAVAPLTSGELHFSDFWPESTGASAAIAGCNGGSSGGCGGG